MGDLASSILLVFCLISAVLWSIAAIQTIIYNRNDEKRRAKRAELEKERSDRELKLFEERLKSIK